MMASTHDDLREHKALVTGATSFSCDVLYRAPRVDRHRGAELQTLPA
jgi:hypothetical protein